MIDENDKPVRTSTVRQSPIAHVHGHSDAGWLGVNAFREPVVIEPSPGPMPPVFYRGRRISYGTMKR
jgi:hypothetical protein